VKRKRRYFALFGLILGGCTAEDLRIDVPSGGLHTINQEDLQRDTWSLMKLERAYGGWGEGTGGEELAEIEIQRRFQALHTLPAFGRAFRSGDGTICARRDGVGSMVLFVAEDLGRGAGESAAAVAALMGLAKAGDSPMPTGPNTLFCRVRGVFDGSELSAAPPVPWTEIDTVVRIGPMGGNHWTAHSTETDERTTVYVTTGPDERHGSDRDAFDSIDYQVLATHTRSMARRFLSGTSSVD